MISQSSAVKSVQPVKEGGVVMNKKEGKAVLCTMVEAELLRVRRSVAVLEDILKQLMIVDAE